MIEMIPMEQKLKFIMFAHARSGSTNLGICLEQHPAVKICGEPFFWVYKKRHPDEKNYIDHVHNKKTLDEQLEEVFSLYTGIKTLEEQLSVKYNIHILENPSVKIIYLERRNILQATVSNFMARQTHIWHRRVSSPRNPKAVEGLQPLSIPKMKTAMKTLLKNQKKYIKALNRRPETSFLHLYYEDLFTDNVRQNKERVSKVFDFLGLEMPETNKILVFLNPEKAKMNSADTYNMVPNIREIEEYLGNDETGWLFK